MLKSFKRNIFFFCGIAGYKNLRTLLWICLVVVFFPTTCYIVEPEEDQNT